MILGGFYISLEIDKNFEKIRGDSLRLCKDLLLLTLQIIIYGILWHCQGFFPILSTLCWYFWPFFDILSRTLVSLAFLLSPLRPSFLPNPCLLFILRNVWEFPRFSAILWCFGGFSSVDCSAGNCDRLITWDGEQEKRKQQRNKSFEIFRAEWSFYDRFASRCRAVFFFFFLSFCAVLVRL